MAVVVEVSQDCDAGFAIALEVVGFELVSEGELFCFEGLEEVEGLGGAEHEAVRGGHGVDARDGGDGRLGGRGG